MERFYASLKTLRPVQAFVLVLILFASGGATYAGYEYSSRGVASGLEEDQQLIPIGYGDRVLVMFTGDVESGEPVVAASVIVNPPEGGGIFGGGAFGSRSRGP